MKFYKVTFYSKRANVSEICLFTMEGDYIDDDAIADYLADSYGDFCEYYTYCADGFDDEKGDWGNMELADDYYENCGYDVEEITEAEYYALENNGAIVV